MARSRKTPYSQSKLNDFLALIGEEVVSIDDEGNPITQEEALARLLYKKAMGWTEEQEFFDEFKQRGVRTVYHKPESWAIQFIFDRRLGRAAPAQQETTKRRASVAETVRDLYRDRVNQLTNQTPPPPPPANA